MLNVDIGLGWVGMIPDQRKTGVWPLKLAIGAFFFVWKERKEGGGKVEDR